MKYINIRLVIGFALLLGFSACGSGSSPVIKGEEVRKNQKQDPYFDVSGRMQSQVEYLISHQAKLTKQANLRGDTDTKTWQPDSSSWHNALNMFINVDINKPVLQGLYEVHDSTTTEGKVRIYKAEGGKFIEVPLVKVYFKDTITNYYKIHAVTQAENVLYFTKRNLIAHFNHENNEPRLKKYKILGRQKMIFQDSMFFETTGQIDY